MRCGLGGGPTFVDESYFKLDARPPFVSNVKLLNIQVIGLEQLLAFSYLFPDTASKEKASALAKRYEGTFLVISEVLIPFFSIPGVRPVEATLDIRESSNQGCALQKRPSYHPHVHLSNGAMRYVERGSLFGNFYGTENP